MTADCLADMPYAEMTTRETLRLAVVITQLPRRAQTTFEVGGYTVPKVSPSTRGRTPLVYPRPPISHASQRG